MKKMLILGAGNAQIDLILYCRKHGIETHGCSNSITDSGVPLLDRFKQIDIADVPAVLKYTIDNAINYIYSVGSDLAMPTVCTVAEQAGLPHFISSHAATICNNKHLLRETLGEDFIGNLWYRVFTSQDEACEHSNFPCMMKPVDSQGQRGVFKIDNMEDLKHYFTKSQSYSKSGKVILEQYVQGREVSVNVYIKNGTILFSLITDREVFDNLPGGIIKEHHVPSQNMPSVLACKIENMVCEALIRLDIKNGPAYFQIMIEDETPYLIEMTPRLDGCHMWNLINHYCKVDLLDVTVRHLTGKKIALPLEPCLDTPLVLEFICAPPGTVFRRADYTVSGDVCWYYNDGDLVKSINGYMEKCGYMIR